MAKRSTPSTPSTARNLTGDFEHSPFRVAYVIAERAYVIIETETGAEGEWFDRYQQAYEACAALNTEAAADERDAEEDMAALHPRYVQRGADVYDTNAGRWYCTLTAWPYSPAARDGAMLGVEQSRRAA